MNPGTVYAVTVLTQPSSPAQVCSVVNGSGTVTSNVTGVQVTCTQPGFKIGGTVVGLVEKAGDTLELQDNAGDNLFVTGDTTFVFPTPVTNGGIYNVQMFLPPTSQTQLCDTFFFTGIAVTNVNTILVDCKHNDWRWDSWYLGNALGSGTTKANNYAAVTTPLQPVNEVFPPNLGTPGGRDFAASWTDKLGRKWLFGGLGFPYPNPLANVGPGILNDLWVNDPSAGGWVPANLPIFTNSANNPPVFQVRVDSLESEGLAPGASPSARWGSASWTDPVSGNLYLFGGQGVGSLPLVLLNDLWKCAPGASVDANGAGTSACVPGRWSEAPPQAEQMVPMALKGRQEVSPVAVGLPRRPQTRPEISGCSAAKVWILLAPPVCSMTFGSTTLRQTSGPGWVLPVRI